MRWPCGGGAAAAALAAAGPAGASQLQQRRGLLGKPSTKPKPVNYQDHNTKRPKRTKIKTRA